MQVEKITAIEPLPSDPNMRRVRLGRRTAATLRAADIEALKLKAGLAWTSALAAAVEGAVRRQAARKAAMRALGRCACSRHELIERLVRVGHDLPISQAIADEMIADHWMNDQTLAEDVARALCRSKPAAAKLIVNKLSARGINRELARSIADRLATEQEDCCAALHFARERLKSMAGLSTRTIQRRIAGLLARRGFDEDTVSAVIDQLHLQPDEE